MSLDFILDFSYSLVSSYFVVVVFLVFQVLQVYERTSFAWRYSDPC